MNQRVEVIGGKAKFFRAGAAFTVPTAGTATQAAVPGAADTGWKTLGIAELGAKLKLDEKEIKDIGTTGHRVRVDIVQYGRTMDHTVKCKQMSNLIFELIFGADAMPESAVEGTDPVVAGGAFVPNENHEGVKGWLSIDYKGRSGQLLNLTVFCRLKPNEDFTPGEEPVEYELLCQELYSAVATGTLA